MALRKLATEAELECRVGEEGVGRPNIVINPRDSHHHHHTGRTEQSKPAKSSIVTFQIPHSDSVPKQKKDRFVLLSDLGQKTLKFLFCSRVITKTERANVMVTSGALIFIVSFL